MKTEVLKSQFNVETSPLDIGKQAMIDICHQLELWDLPDKNFDGTNMEDLSGLTIDTHLTISQLEKVTLYAAGFTRVPEFTTRKMGILKRNTDHKEWLINHKNDDPIPLNHMLNTIFKNKQIAGIRITPSESSSNYTNPSRPFQKIETIDHPSLLKRGNSIIGLYQNKNGYNKYINPYLLKEDDTIEIFVEPKADKDLKGNPLAGSFLLQILPSLTCNMLLTKSGADIRNINDQDVIESGNRKIISQHPLLGPKPDDPIFAQFFQQDKKAILTLANAVQTVHPNNSEINIEGHYAIVDGKIIVYAFDIEIPIKTASQWLQFRQKKSMYFDGYPEATATQFIKPIYNRFLYYQKQGD